MTQQQSIQILFPPGRMVQGSLYRPFDKNRDGTPRVYPPGHAKAGQPKINYFFAIAIEKKGERAWWETVWGAQIVALAQAEWPQGQWQQTTFAWKIDDGDSQVPNKNQRVNARTEGMPGHWIVELSSMQAPKVWELNSAKQPVALTTPDTVKLGYFVEVHATVKSNESKDSPGVYINYNHVVFVGMGKEISSGPDVNAIQFGRVALPAGASQSPLPSGVALPGGAPVMPGAPAMPGMPGVATPPAMPGMVAPPTMVAANPSFIQPPGGVQAPVAPGAPSMAAPPPPAAPAAYVDPKGAPAGYRMVNPAGPTYQSYVSQGWTDALMMQHNAMVRL